MPYPLLVIHGPEQLLLELFAIFVSAKVVGEVFERFRLPSVLGEILAGVALGPFALRWIQPSDIIYSVAELGAIFVLFSAGLETSPRDLIRVGNKAIQVAGAGVIVPFVLGFLYMRIRGDAFSEAIFVGAANGGHQRRHYCPRTWRSSCVVDTHGQDHSWRRSLR